MIIGMVQVVPRAKAETNKKISVTATYGGPSGEAANFEVYLKTDTLTYNGQAQLPEIASFTCTNSNFNGTLSIAGTGATNAGDYTCGLDATGWTFPANCISYKIQQANIASINAEVISGKKVQKYTGNNVVPQPSDIKVTADVDGIETTIDPSQYTVTGGQTECGPATCSISINATNYTGTLTKSDITYTIAYDLDGKVGYTASISSTEIAYGPSMTLPTITLTGDKTINVNNAQNIFNIKYYKNGVETSVDSVGNYTVKVTPKNGSSSYCRYRDDEISPNYIYFTGEYSAEFSVKALSVDDLTVIATDPLTGQQIEISNNRNTLVVSYVAGTRAEPPVIVQAGSKVITEDCSITYPDANSAGEARIVITPDTSKTNYTGTLTIKYYIKSNIELTSFRFKDQTTGTAQIVYDGLDHTLDEYVVKNAAGAVLNDGLDYTITYQYWNGSSYQDADTANRKTVGKKRIRVIGKNTYSGREAYQEYEILPVDISEGGPYWRNVSVEYTDGPYTYNGQEVKPAFTVKYNGLDVGTNTDTNGQFTFNYNNNTDAGNCDTGNCILRCKLQRYIYFELHHQYSVILRRKHRYSIYL